MGQAFVLRNYNTGEYVHPHKMGFGYKLGEFGHFTEGSEWDFAGSLWQLARELTADGGKWHGDLVLFVGDNGDAYTVAGELTTVPEGVIEPKWKTVPKKNLWDWMEKKMYLHDFGRHLQRSLMLR